MNRRKALKTMLAAAIAPFTIPAVAQSAPVVVPDPTILAWESMGGIQLNFKVMSIMIPRLKSPKVLYHSTGVG